MDTITQQQAAIADPASLSVNELAKTLREAMESRDMSLMAVCREWGWSYNAVYARLRDNGWTVRRTLVYRGKAMTKRPGRG